MCLCFWYWVKIAWGLEINGIRYTTPPPLVLFTDKKTFSCICIALLYDIIWEGICCSYYLLTKRSAFVQLCLMYLLCQCQQQKEIPFNLVRRKERKGNVSIMVYSYSYNATNYHTSILRYNQKMHVHYTYTICTNAKSLTLNAYKKQNISQGAERVKVRRIYKFV